MTLQLLSERQAKTLIETGVARHGLEKTKTDGASTVVLGLWARQNQALLHSVDINPAAVEVAAREIERRGLKDSVRLHLSDSIDFLEDFPESVDFLYLDSYDYDDRDEATQKASQGHHLKELKAIENRLHDRSVVLIDDCRLPGGGKGKSVIEYMSSRNWRILMEEYQVLLIRDL